MTCLNALGVVYGDIGTSVLYVFESIFPDGDPDPVKVKGALCIIIYTITWIVCVKYPQSIDICYSYKLKGIYVLF
jgi:KUP system potassium uptake protein